MQLAREVTDTKQKEGSASFAVLKTEGHVEKA